MKAIVWQRPHYIKDKVVKIGMRLLATFFALTHALTPKLCIHCKHFMNQPSGPQFGKCALFSYKEEDDLVTGKVQETQYRYCSTARSSERLCGKKGKQYVSVDNFEAIY
jgi:hypothetical protein